VQIDWFTFAAQIVNFLVLLAILKRLLYDRIVAAMDRREQEIAGRLEEAERQQREATEQKERYQDRQEQLETRRNKILSQARDEAEETKKSLLGEAREEVEAKRRQWQDALKREQSDFRKQVQHQGTRQVVAISRQIVADLANRDLEEQVVATWRDQLESLNDDQWQQLREATGKNDGLTISSAFKLSQSARQSIEKPLTEHLGKISPTYRESDRVVFGIVLEAGGFQLAWSADSYLEDLTQSLAKMVEERTRITNGPQHGTNSDNKSQDQEEQSEDDKREE
jgi:F-type H+-transporting ATPase subunit b